MMPRDNSYPFEQADQETDTGIGKGRIIREELEAVRKEEAQLAKEQRELEELLEASRQWLGFDVHHFQEALSVSLSLMGVEPLQPDNDRSRWTIPNLEATLGGDPAWAAVVVSIVHVFKECDK
jgi:hypothetical protein